ncbi:MAG: asparagine synthase (glutamine-hydrolyzing) [Deltaproteobacteria bacterium]|nr:asparagine synthase (glutamine-hydrolyzing) [Deltaproteobacteria bacterium]
MCGIAGIVAREAAEDVVRRMLARIAHRGPDGEGLAVRRVGKRVATFGHRRLSIVDLAGGAQPMEDAGTRDRPGARALVTFNGEIYDHAKTREALRREGARFVTRGSDTETLVSGYASWGERVVPRLSGMFAFAAMDLRSGEVLLARDRSGIKPLYWARLSESTFEGGGIAFASELDALLEVPGIERRIDDQGLASFLFSDYAHPPYTLVRGVSKLAPGELLVLRGDGSEDGPRRYVAPQVPEEGPVPDARELLETLGDAVESQLMSDVPLGVFLSGGIDSSVIAALAHQRLARRGSKPRLQAFCIAFEEASFDESAHARAVSQHLGLEHVEEVLSPRAMLDVVDEVLDHLDEPLGDHSIVPTYLLCRLAAKHVKVALGGDAADELFGGYPTYAAHARHARAMRPFVTSARAILGPDRVGALLDRLPSGDGYQALDWKLKRFVGRWDDDVVRRHLRWMSSLDLPALSEAMGDRLRGEPATLAEAHRWWGDPIATTTTLDFATYMPGSVLTKVDRASMAHGLEARPPFLDEGVLALARRVPSSLKVRGGVGKVLLREAARSLVPPAILDRKKHGFSVPLAAWLRGPLSGRLDALLASSPVWTTLEREPFARWAGEHRARRGDHTKALWALVVLDRWMRSTGVRG